MSLKKTAISGFVWTFTQQFGSQAINFFVSVIMARLLSPAEFGLIAMVSVFLSIGLSLIDSGLTQSLIRNNALNQDDYSTVFFFNLTSSFFVYGLLFFSAPFIADFFKQPILTDITRVYCLSFIISAFSSIPQTRLNKNMDFKSQTLIAIFSLMIASLLGIYLAFKNYGVWSLIFMYLLQNFLNASLLFWYAAWRPCLVFNIEKFKYHFKFGYKLTLSGLLDIIFNNSYPFIIGKYFSISEVGFFNRADSLKQLPVNAIGSALNKVTYPLFTNLKDNDERLKNIYKRIMEMVIFLIAPILIFLGVLAEPTFRLLFTEKWLPAVDYFQLLCVTGILYPIHVYNLNILIVKGRSDLFFQLEIIKKIIFVAIVMSSISFGIFGLLWGQIAFSIVCLVVNTHYSGKLIDYSAWQQIKDILPIIIMAGIAGGFVYQAMPMVYNYSNGLIHSHQLNDIIVILLSSLFGLIAYLSMAYFFKINALNEIKNVLR